MSSGVMREELSFRQASAKVPRMDPRYRFTMVVSILLVVWWLWEVVTTFLVGPTGLNWERYQQGIMVLAIAASCGFVTVWLALQLIGWQRQRKTGFEAEPFDEFGTAYEMMSSTGESAPFNMALSKFHPALVAPPAASASLHPLEAELIGFLHGYRHWPLTPDHPETKLYEQAIARWQVMRNIPGATPWHRAAALAKDLGVVSALEEKRTPPRWYQFTTQDSVRFSRRSLMNPGMSSLVLSTMPSFRALQKAENGPEIQRALLTAIRYSTTPQYMPLNAGPLAAALVEGLTRAEAQLGLMDVSEVDRLTPARQEALAAGLQGWFLDVMDSLTPSALLVPDASHHRSILANQPAHWVRLDTFLSTLGPKLEPGLRTALGLWDTPKADPRQQPAWAHLMPLLIEQGLIHDNVHGVAAEAGCFHLTAPDGSTWGPCLLINLETTGNAPLKAKWQNLPAGPVAELALTPDTLKARAELQLQSLDAKMREIF